MLQWLRRRQAAERLAQADAEALIRDHGGEAYGEARQRERDVVLLDGTTHAGRTPAHWRRVALIVARMTGEKSAQLTSCGRSGHRPKMLCLRSRLVQFSFHLQYKAQSLPHV